MAPGIPNRDKYRSDQISALADKLNEVIEKLNLLLSGFRKVEKIDVHHLD